ncbi:MAG: YjbQ family protein [Magnetococcales bacterium]|nr:YjbQ family protein [Magnetococcales bacterium]MBF0157507.1 YjbQ family protein [Magnetococcales bacterium]
MRTLAVVTHKGQEFIEVTAAVTEVVRGSGIQEGICHLFVPHTTAAVTLNENCDPDVVLDLVAILDRLVPSRGDYRHAEGNSDAHAKASLIGTATSIPVSLGTLQLGTWQGIWFCEFDGPRNRRLCVQVIGR